MWHLPESSDAPPWVDECLIAAPWVVVRNGLAPPGHVAVGVRGPTRADRWATQLPFDEIIDIRTPESMSGPDAWNNLPEIAAARSLRAFASTLRSQWTWGPAGSVGFTVATGLNVCSESSDLDVVVRCPIRPEPSSLHLLGRACSLQESRVDCQVETPVGAVHLEDLLSGERPLIRSRSGPRLCFDPWNGTGP
jgi:phosphoribosyl-dephospho-CoA transferase